jgi:hypothetical protein
MIYSKAVFQLFGWPAVCDLINRDRLLSRVPVDGLGFDSNFFFRSVGSAIAAAPDLRYGPGFCGAPAMAS